MASFDIAYDADDDVLEAWFDGSDEDVSQAVAANENITLYVDAGRSRVLGITLLEYSRLLGVSETEFTGLRDSEEEDPSVLLGLIATPPASLFFDITDPEGLIARVVAPRVQDLVQLGIS